MKDSKVVTYLLVDLLMGDVRPEDLLGSHIHVQRHHVLQSRDDTDILTSVQRHLPHLVAIGKEQVSHRTCQIPNRGSFVLVC